MPGPFVVSYIALWILVVLQALILLGLTRSFYDLRQGSGSNAAYSGRPVPKFSVVDLQGRPVSSESISGKAAALLFVSPNCPSCMVTLAELEPLRHDTKRGLVVVCNGTDDECNKVASDYSLTMPVVADTGGDLMKRLGVSGTPMAVRISAQGLIESYGEPARGEDLEELLAGHQHTEELGVTLGESDRAGA